MRKTKVFAKRLAEYGISIASDNVAGYGKYIMFCTEISPQANGCKTVMVATNTGLIKSEWRTEDGEKSADVSPILMVEFGSGLRANNPKAAEFGMGTGTFPGQNYAQDPSGWWYMDLDGEWHHSYGVAPSMPMYKAAMEMQRNIWKIAKEVFGT